MVDDDGKKEEFACFFELDIMGEGIVRLFGQFLSGKAKDVSFPAAKFALDGDLPGGIC